MELLHICCAECLAGVVDEFRAEGTDVVGFFYNPNIHPLLEFRRRLKAVKVLQQRTGLDVVYDEEYGLQTFLRDVHGKPGDRCEHCYRLRMERTAAEAKRLGCDSFTTTLFVSGHQKHDLLKRVAEEAAEKAGVRLDYRDMRHLAARCAERAKKFSLYRQSYCGCVFSEYERFKDTTRYL